jgi:AcrR family transcriptional regulator
VAEDTGRVNQKRRTRQAIVDAAQRLMDAGTVPTVADAAAEAEVGRTTAYRYFPTQESLLVELAVTSGEARTEELVAQPVTAAEARDRVLELIRRFNGGVLADEVRYRTADRLYQDQWLAASAGGEDQPMVRQGRRRRWFTTLLTPLMDEHRMSKAAREQLVNQLSLTCGAEPVIVLRDVCHLSGTAVLDVTERVARLILDEAFGPTPKRKR